MASVGPAARSEVGRPPRQTGLDTLGDTPDEKRETVERRDQTPDAGAQAAAASLTDRMENLHDDLSNAVAPAGRRGRNGQVEREGLVEARPKAASLGGTSWLPALIERKRRGGTREGADEHDCPHVIVPAHHPLPKDHIKWG